MQSHCMTIIRGHGGCLGAWGLGAETEAPVLMGTLLSRATTALHAKWGRENKRGREAVEKCSSVRTCLWHTPVLLTNLKHWCASTARSHELDDYKITQFTGFGFRQYLHRPAGKWRLKVQHNMLLFHSNKLAAVVAVEEGKDSAVCVRACVACSKGW